MKVAVIGATGCIGEVLVPRLRGGGFAVVEASPTRGVDTITGEGLARALDGADVVVDVSNSPSTDGPAAERFFEASGRRLLAAAKAAGVGHHIALSIVGTDGLQASGYFRGKKIQEDLIRAAGIPYSLLRSTQFFEFIAGVVQDGGAGDVTISPALSQPISRFDVARALAELVAGDPLNGAVEVAGPERWRLSDLATEVLTAFEDPRRIVADPAAPYFGAQVSDGSLLPGPEARIGALRFEDWLRQALQPSSQRTPA